MKRTTDRSCRTSALIWTVVLLCAAAAWGSAVADTLSGQVIAVSDGDTIGVLDAQRVTHRVRLAGIDAPELGQPFSQRSKQHLAGLVHGRDVQVEWNKLDRYGRIVGKVLADDLDVCREMVAAGLAWHYKAYQHEQPAEDQKTYSGAEDAARQGHVGLWSEPQPMPPWEYRARRRASAAPQSR
jgi:endonuclease YncB( thermonuclease family)